MCGRIGQKCWQMRMCWRKSHETHYCGIWILSNKSWRVSIFSPYHSFSTESCRRKERKKFLLDKESVLHNKCEWIKRGGKYLMSKVKKGENLHKSKWSNILRVAQTVFQYKTWSKTKKKVKGERNVPMEQISYYAVHECYYPSKNPIHLVKIEQTFCQLSQSYCYTPTSNPQETWWVLLKFQNPSIQLKFQ